MSYNLTLVCRKCNHKHKSLHTCPACGEPVLAYPIGSDGNRARNLRRKLRKGARKGRG